MYQIRQLAPVDVALLQDLNALFGRVFDDPDAYCSKRPGKEYLEDLLAREHIVVLVALSDSEVVGVLVAYQLDKFEQARSELYIYDLAVAERHRRQGLATALIRSLQEVASDRNAWVVFSFRPTMVTIRRSRSMKRSAAAKRSCTSIFPCGIRVEVKQIGAWRNTVRYPMFLTLRSILRES